MRKLLAVILVVLFIPSVIEAQPWYKDKKFWVFAAGSMASSFLATKGISDCRREFGPSNCSGGAGPSFRTREGLRLGGTFGANLLSWKLRRDHEKPNSNPLTSLWYMPQIGAAAWNTTTFMRNDPDVAVWKKVALLRD